MLMELAIAALNAMATAGGLMTSSGAQDRRPPAAFVGHEREFSELHLILADFAQSSCFLRLERRV